MMSEPRSSDLGGDPELLHFPSERRACSLTTRGRSYSLGSELTPTQTSGLHLSGARLASETEHGIT